MLDRIFSDKGEDKDKYIAFVQEYFGVSIFGGHVNKVRSMRKGVILYGPPRTGKTTIADVLRELYGDDAIASPDIASLKGSFGLSQLLGVSAIVLTDLYCSLSTDCRTWMMKLTRCMTGS